MTPPDEADIEAVVRALRDESEGDTHSDAVAAIAALRGRGWAKVPEGWTLAPVKPTQRMLDAGYCPAVQRRGAKSVWGEMLSAAPEPPA